jgi:hypothetical protein
VARPGVLRGNPGDSGHIPSTRGVDIRSLQVARSPSVSVRYGRPTTRYPRLRIHPLFATLRATAANRRPRVDLVNEFWKRALLVHWLAKHAATDRVARDASLLDEWRITVQACPRLASIPFKAPLLSKLSAFEKTVTPRALASGFEAWALSKWTREAMACRMLAVPHIWTGRVHAHREGGLGPQFATAAATCVERRSRMRPEVFIVRKVRLEIHLRRA